MISFMMNRFKELIVWQKAMTLATLTYALTDGLPSKERFGLISQINRCAVSIPSNIAEGAGRNSKKEYKYFLSIAQASSFELETQLLICQNLKYKTLEQLKIPISIIHEIQKMLYSLQKNLQ